MIDKSDIVRTSGEGSETRLSARFLGKVARDENGCWLWQGALSTPGGYAVFVSPPHRYAHRYAYAVLVGDIPDGQELDHLCRVRHCVNPQHLEAVPHYVNLTRAPFMNLTACKWGHEFTEENTALRTRADGTTYRQCRACVRIRAAVRECARHTKENAPRGGEALSHTEGV